MKRSLGKKWERNHYFLIKQFQRKISDTIVPRCWLYQIYIISYSSHGLIISNSSHIAQVSSLIIHAHDQNRFSIQNSLIENSLTVIKRQVSRWNEAFLRSHNAGSYYCAFHKHAVRALDSAFVFSNLLWLYWGPRWERHIWPLSCHSEEAHYALYIDEGNDVKTVSDMKAAIDSHGGVKGCYSAVCKVDDRSQNIFSGIQSSCPLKVERLLFGGLTMSVASVTSLGTPHGLTNLQARQAFSSPGNLTGLPFLFQHAGITACSTSSGAYSLRRASAWRRREYGNTFWRYRERVHVQGDKKNWQRCANQFRKHGSSLSVHIYLSFP